MDKLKQNLQRRKEKSKVTVKTNAKSVITGSVIATFICITPYLFYLYESVPETQVWNTFLFTYDSHGWGDANFAMWVFTNKIIPFCLLLIWFFTNRHWWYHTLIVPIAMYIFQIIGIFNENIAAIDKFELIYMVPVMAIVVPSVYLIRARMFNKINDADKTMEELEQEFMIKPTTFMGKVRQYF